MKFYEFTNEDVQDDDLDSEEQSAPALDDSAHSSPARISSRVKNPRNK